MTVDDIKEVQTLVNENDQPVIYILNLHENSGFVVMSASFVEKPILAYGFEGNFDLDGLGDYGGVIEWTYTKFLKIDGLIKKGDPLDERITMQWNAVNPSFGFDLVDNNGNVVPWIPPVIVDQYDETYTYGPLLTTRWNQRLSNDPNTSVIGYNNYVRSYNCSLNIAPTGCVATAMGQIMKYFDKWPNAANLSLQTMPNLVNSNNHQTQEAKNIALLMHELGQRFGMNYGCDGSGAHSGNARQALVNQYGYSATLVVALNYNPLVQNIFNHKPVYLDGCSERIVKTTPIRLGKWSIGKTTYKYDGCHAWVADGYEKIERTTTYDTGYTFTTVIADNFHMNWGWGGSYNGWYDYEYWDDINGNNIPDVDYIYKQNMIYNITPN